MVQRVWGQLKIAGLDKNCIITAGKAQTEILKSQLGADISIASEPVRRDTFPAVVLSCAYIKSELGGKDDDVVAVLPVDPFTENGYFSRVRELENVLSESGSDIVLMGAKPTYNSAKYGYIVPEEKAENDIIKVKCFKEKPTEEQAAELISGGALWNCGIFCFKIKTVLENAKPFLSDDSYSYVYDNYEKLPRISFDYQVLEKCSAISALSFDGYWKDLGTWNTLTEEMKINAIGNVVLDESSCGTSVINELKLPVVVMGAKNMIVAASPDGILVAEKSRSSFIKESVDKLNLPCMYEERRWGTIEVINYSTTEENTSAARKINFFSGMNSSYHYHNRRKEIWTFLKGEGVMIIEGDVRKVKAGDVVEINSGQKHSLRAFSDIEFIEIQIGGSFADEDINRLNFDWNEIVKEITS